MENSVYSEEGFFQMVSGKQLVQKKQLICKQIKKTWLPENRNKSEHQQTNYMIYHNNFLYRIYMNNFLTVPIWYITTKSGLIQIMVEGKQHYRSIGLK